MNAKEVIVKPVVHYARGAELAACGVKWVAAACEWPFVTCDGCLDHARRTP